MTNNRIKVYWFFLLMLMFTAGMLMSIGETYARYENTVTGSTLVEAEPYGISSDCLITKKDAPLTVLLGELALDQSKKVSFTLRSTGTDAAGTLAWGVIDPDQAKFLNISMQSGGEAIEPNEEVDVMENIDMEISMTIMPTEKARNIAHEAMKIHVVVTWGDKMWGTFQVILPAVEAKDTQEPTEEETTDETTGDNTDEPTGDNTDEPTGDNTDDPTGDNTDDPTGDNTDDPTGDNTDDPTGDNTDDPTGDNGDNPTGDNGDNPTGDNTDDPTGDDADEPTGDNTDDPTGDDADDPTGDDADDPTGDNGDNTTGDNTDDPTGDDADDPTGDNTDDPAGDNGDNTTGDNTDDPAGDNGDNPTGDDADDPAGDNGDNPTGDDADDPTGDNTDDPATETTESTVPTEGEIAQKNIRLEALPNFDPAGKLPLKIVLTENVTSIRLGLCPEEEEETAVAQGAVAEFAPFPDATKFSLNGGDSYYMMYDGFIAEFAVEKMTSISVLLDLANTDLDKSKDLIVVMEAYAGQELVSTDVISVTPDAPERFQTVMITKEEWLKQENAEESGVAVAAQPGYTGKKRILNQDNILKIELPMEWSSAELEYSVDMLKMTESQNLVYSHVNLAAGGLSVEYTNDEKAHNLILRVLENLPQAGTYRLNLQWSYEGICFAQTQITFFINYAANTDFVLGS